MITFYLLSRLPVWATLSPVQRRFVWRECVHPMLVRWPMMIAKTCLLIVALLVGKWAGAYQNWFGGGLVVFSGVLLGDLLELALIIRRRDRVSQFIHDHESQIRAAA
jgi:hypothetical protein